MASDVMSLFGMDPNVIQQNRVQSGVDQASRMSKAFAIGAAGGGLVGSAANTAFGLQTPDMAQAASVQSGLQGQDLTTVAGLRAAAQQLMMNGDYAQAMALHAQARDMEAKSNELIIAAEDRALGKPSNVIVTPASYDQINGRVIPAVSHTITRYPDGTVLDATQGKSFTNEAEWAESLKSLGTTDNTDVPDTIKTPEDLIQNVKAERIEREEAFKELPMDEQVLRNNLATFIQARDERLAMNVPPNSFVMKRIAEIEAELTAMQQGK